MLGLLLNTLLLLLRNNFSREHPKVLYQYGGQEKSKNKKTRKSKSEEKVVGRISASLSPARKREAVTQCGARGIHHPARRITHGAGIVKGWEDKRDHGRIDTLT